MYFILIIIALLLIIVTITEISLKFYSNKFFRNKIEFPFTHPQVLQKFKNFDSYLGWEPKPVEEAIDTGHHRSRTYSSKTNKPKYSIKPDGSRFQPDSGNSLNGQPIDFFGDSVTFCRDVENNETFQYYLEKDFGMGPCKNFGVGSYGVDQSYLRAKRRMSGNGIAVLYMPLLSLYRTGAIYKHYATPGNNWALKPRFILENGEFKLIPTPVKQREELSDLSKYAHTIRTYDNHYKDFKNYLLPDKGSYITYFAKNKHALPELTKKLLKKSDYRVYKKSLKLFDKFLKKFTNKTTYKEYMRSGEKLIEYSEGEEGKLFAQIAKEFSELSITRGSKPFIFVSPQGYPMKYPKEYNQAVHNLEYQCQLINIELYDLGEAYFALGENEKHKYHVSKTHASPEGNRFIASWLAKKFRENGFLNKRIEYL